MAKKNKGDRTNPKGPIALGKEVEETSNKTRFPYVCSDYSYKLKVEELAKSFLEAEKTEKLCTETVPFPKDFRRQIKMSVLQLNERSGEITTIDYGEWKKQQQKRAAEKLERNGRKHKKKIRVVSNGKHNKKRKNKVARSTRLPEEK